MMGSKRIGVWVLLVCSGHGLSSVPKGNGRRFPCEVEGLSVEWYEKLTVMELRKLIKESYPEVSVW